MLLRNIQFLKILILLPSEISGGLFSDLWHFYSKFTQYYHILQEVLVEISVGNKNFIFEKFTPEKQILHLDWE